MLLYIQNPKDSITKLLELIKVAGYKVAVHRNHLHFYIVTMKNQEEKLKNQSHSTKRIKYLGINLPKETKELYTENYKTLVKEIKDDTSRWRNSPCSWVGRTNILKMTILPNAL